MKYFKITSYDNMSLTKVVLLFTYWKKKIIFRELQLIFDTKNWVWKSKNALFWWLGALSFCQVWKNLLVPMNVDLKDYSNLGAYLQIVLPWITIPKTRPDLKIRVSPMVEILRVKITLGTLWRPTFIGSFLLINLFVFWITLFSEIVPYFCFLITKS